MLHSNERPVPSQNEHKSYFPILTKSFSDGLVPVYENENGDLVCNARKLHSRLKTRTKFTMWTERKLLIDDFQEGEDYFPLLGNRSDGKSGKPKTDFELTIDTAKELAMLERNEEGKKVRRYFIQVEKAFKAMLKALFTPINGIMPIHQNGKIGVPRKEFLISIGRSATSGSASGLRKQYQGQCFNIGRTACISSELAHILMDEQKLKARKMLAKSNQLTLGL